MVLINFILNNKDFIFTNRFIIIYEKISKFFKKIRFENFLSKIKQNWIKRIKRINWLLNFLLDTGKLSIRDYSTYENKQKIK